MSVAVPVAVAVTVSVLSFISWSFRICFTSFSSVMRPRTVAAYLSACTLGDCVALVFIAGPIN